MDYSSVTTGDLLVKTHKLVEYQGDLALESQKALVELERIRAEIRRRRVGTTDDRVEWQEVGLR